MKLSSSPILLGVAAQRTIPTIPKASMNSMIVSLQLSLRSLALKTTEKSPQVYDLLSATSLTDMRREARLISLPSKVSFLMLAGMRCTGKIIVQISGVPVSGDDGGRVWITSRTPTLTWTSVTAVDSVVTMEWSWATAEEIDCRDASEPGWADTSGGKSSLKSLTFLAVVG